MKIIEKVFDNDKYYYIGEYKLKFGTIHKFSNTKNSIFCTKKKNDFFKITETKILNKIEKEFYKMKIEDIV